MRIRGQEVKCREYREVEIPRKNQESIRLKVFALPLGFRADYDRMNPAPRPPISTTVINGKPNKVEDYTDAKFLDAISEHRDLGIYYMLYLALSGDSEVQFTNVPTDLNSLRLFRQELKDSGLSDGDIKIIVDTAMAAGNINTEDVDRAKKDF